MRIEFILSAAACVFSLLNLLFLLALSNSIFRILVVDKEQRQEPKKANLTKQNKEESGLVEVGQFPTYDPRFRA